ncbi:hypothetical protein [Mesorhizobium sp. INR15]|uniref:hypothetical protein n=1 Tax=Mesorhizobium sp. INR15 TaxID=2654248 RepID=UPI0018969293|nr:hypothetical protein [Mesorhizobium sp. INR15]QPC95863.1 hypothetical protein GA829_35610 [Mesorhizobium sp. INR15]
MASGQIVQYSLDGKVLRTLTVKGHDDGLRLAGDKEDPGRAERGTRPGKAALLKVILTFSFSRF